MILNPRITINRDPSRGENNHTQPRVVLKLRLLIRLSERQYLALHISVDAVFSSIISRPLNDYLKSYYKCYYHFTYTITIISFHATLLNGTPQRGYSIKAKPHSI